jgi:hypothetical protein
MTTILNNAWGRVDRDGAKVALIVDVPEDVWAGIPADRKRGLRSRMGLVATPGTDTVILSAGLGVRTSTRPELAALVATYQAAEAEIKAAREHILGTVYAGREEIQHARWAEIESHDALMRAIERGDGRMPRGYAGPASSDLIGQYPAAAAYLRAESYRDGAHYMRSAAGRRALERMEAGEDYEIVIVEMEAEWHAAAAECCLNS